jgi:hypothetical protein
MASPSDFGSTKNQNRKLRNRYLRAIDENALSGRIALWHL